MNLLATCEKKRFAANEPQDCFIRVSHIRQVRGQIGRRRPHVPFQSKLTIRTLHAVGVTFKMAQDGGCRERCGPAAPGLTYST